jgi:hypothetical protein
MSVEARCEACYFLSFNFSTPWLDDTKFMRKSWVRGILYGMAISLAIGMPRNPPNETTCPYSVYLAPKYIGKKIGIVEGNNQEIVIRERVCSIYLGFPFVYVSDIYDVRPTYVSLTRMSLNLILLFIVIEVFIFFVNIGKERKNEIY